MSQTRPGIKCGSVGVKGKDYNPQFTGAVTVVLIFLTDLTTGDVTCVLCYHLVK